MNKNIYTRDEFLAKAQITEKNLAEWEKAKLVRAVGFNEDQIPFYSEDTAEIIASIQKLIESGYGLEEIQKIIKKVGLPKSARAKKKEPKKIQYLTVGVLAEQARVSPRTIKHWEDMGIIEPDMRSEGGFRMYSAVYVYLCELIKDLQLFGYTLQEIKLISDYFRDFLSIRGNSELYSGAKTRLKLESMLSEIHVLSEKMELLKEGIERWEDLLKKKKKEVLNLKTKNEKRQEKDASSGGKPNE